MFHGFDVFWYVYQRGTVKLNHSHDPTKNGGPFVARRSSASARRAETCWACSPRGRPWKLGRGVEGCHGSHVGWKIPMGQILWEKVRGEIPMGNRFISWKSIRPKYRIEESIENLLDAYFSLMVYSWDSKRHKMTNIMRGWTSGTSDFHMLKAEYQSLAFHEDVTDFHIYMI